MFCMVPDAQSLKSMRSETYKLASAPPTVPPPIRPELER
jgi:hypothetical protein